MQLNAETIATLEADRQDRHEQALAAAAAAARAPGRRRRTRDRGGAPLQRRRSLLGARHGRHPLRALPRRRRAAGDRGEARRRRDAERPHRCEPHGQPARAVGRTGRRSRLAPVRRGARARLRRDELEHVPGQPVHDGRRRRHLQVRVDGCRGRRGSRGRGRAQPPRDRARRAARLLCTQHLARRRNQPSGTGELPAASSTALPTACAGSTARCQTAGCCSQSTSRTSPRSTPRSSRTGARRCCSRRPRGGRRAASSTSATTSRTRTSSRSSHDSR